MTKYPRVISNIGLFNNKKCSEKKKFFSVVTTTEIETVTIFLVWFNFFFLII